MINRKKAKLIIKLLIAVLSLIILIRFISFTLSRYQSKARSNANVDVAFYVLNKNFQTMTLNLGGIFPNDTPYTYSFSIANTDGTNNAETDLQYDLKIRTTTNMPITYELYMNQKYTDSGANNIITDNSVAQDADGTYFRTITTNTITLLKSNITTNLYQLVVRFPSTYNTTKYQDLIDAIEISVDSKQVI